MADPIDWRGRLSDGLDAVRAWSRSIKPEKDQIRPEALAGLPGAIGSVPDGMAASVLAGVNPIHGLYASMVGPIFGGLFASTDRVVITTTSAAALAAGSVMVNLDPMDRPAALFLLTLMAGLLMIVAGVLRLGRYVRFVSHSVMTGFLTGVAANIVFSQVPDLTGAEAEGPFALARAIDVITNPGRIDLATLVAGLGALGLVAVASKSRFASIAALGALVVPSAVVAILGFKLTLVADVGEIPRGFPLPALPELRLLSPGLITGAFAVAAIVLVQGSGVSEAAPNLDGSRSDANRDFRAQGAGNVAAALFQGQPVGGSVGQTALNVSAGAKTRWASIASGIWMLLILVAFSPLVGRVAMTTLAAVLTFAAIGSIKPAQVLLVLRTGMDSVVGGVTTFVATLFLPIAAAVGIGVALSLLLQINREAMDLRVIELVPNPQGGHSVAPAPAVLTDRQVTIIDVFGSLFYAGAKTLEARLPDPTGTTRPAVVLRLRGRTTLTSTAVEVISSYADRLAKQDGRLFLSGVEQEVVGGLRSAGGLIVLGPVEVVVASDMLGESTRRAVELAGAWVAKGGEPLPEGQIVPHGREIEQ
jgi:sulfate permease, SulP family